MFFYPYYINFPIIPQLTQSPSFIIIIIIITIIIVIISIEFTMIHQVTPNPPKYFNFKPPILFLIFELTQSLYPSLDQSLHFTILIFIIFHLITIIDYSHQTFSSLFF